MRLLFVVNVDWFFLSHRLPVALRALETGFEVHLATVVTEHKQRLEALGVRVHTIALDRSSSNPIAFVFNLWSLASVIRRVKPDVIHLVTIKPVLLGGIASRLFRVPALVAAISGLGTVFVAQSRVEALRRYVVERAYRFALTHRNKRVIFQNTEDMKRLRVAANISDNECVLIPGSGVDLGKYSLQALPDDTRIVLFAARLIAQKGVREFVAAARRVRSALRFGNQSVRFVIAGQFDPSNPSSISESELERWVEEDVIEYWGQRDDMQSVLGRAYLVVLPSYYGEGLPKILIEAAACGRAIVTTDHPGCRDAIESEVTGVLVPPKNVAALSAAIEELLSQRERVRLMGLAARRRAETLFNECDVVDAHLKIYRELVLSS